MKTKKQGSTARCRTDAPSPRRASSSQLRLPFAPEPKAKPKRLKPAADDRWVLSFVAPTENEFAALMAADTANTQGGTERMKT